MAIGYHTLANALKDVQDTGCSLPRYIVFFCNYPAHIPRYHNRHRIIGDANIGNEDQGSNCQLLCPVSLSRSPFCEPADTSGNPLQAPLLLDKFSQRANEHRQSKNPLHTGKSRRNVTPKRGEFIRSCSYSLHSRQDRSQNQNYKYVNPGQRQNQYGQIGQGQQPLSSVPRNRSLAFRKKNKNSYGDNSNWQDWLNILIKFRLHSYTLCPCSRNGCI